ncbi:YphA family membrane protein [Bacillus sp. JJ722]|uniref:YphA family membrane protein n=1 Tax=Bacillus sp. JJ722 TaxID=3122973 RepID=UPI003000F213
MNGLIFIWGSWILLTVFVFFLYHKINSSIVAHLLIILFLSQFYISINPITLNGAVIYLMIIVCRYIGCLTFKNQFHVMLASFIVALCQGSYYFFLTLEPLWFSWIPMWGSSILLLYISILLLKDNRQRMMALIMGMIISDLLLFIVYYRTGLSYELFSLSWLDHIAVVALVLLIWYTIESIGNYLFDDSKHYHKKEV